MPNKPASRKQRQAKDRVLQARIPEQLDDELRGRAEQLGLSVSTIVRNVLLHTFDLVEGVVTDSSQIARALAGQKASTSEAQGSLPTPSSPDTGSESHIIGWQEAVLNLNGVCEDCNCILPKGESAAIGIPTGPRAVLLCRKCLDLRTASALGSSKSKPPANKKKAVSTRAPSGRKKGRR